MDYFLRIDYELYYPSWTTLNGRPVLDLKPVNCAACRHYVCDRLNMSSFFDLSKKCGLFDPKE